MEPSQSYDHTKMKSPSSFLIENIDLDIDKDCQNIYAEYAAYQGPCRTDLSCAYRAFAPINSKRVLMCLDTLLFS